MKIVGFLSLLLVLSTSQLHALSLEEAVDLSSRTAEFKERDRCRHPVATLQFFDVSPDQTVVEIWPGGGWYTEILAPYLKANGHFFAAHFPADSEIPYFTASREQFEQKLKADTLHYDAVQVVDFQPEAGILGVSDNSADRVLTFRNVHNWLRNDAEAKAFELFFRALKPGGMLGVVEHRSKVGQSREWMLKNGYMNQNYVIELAKAAGFQLVNVSEINANPLDTADHPAGVWTLPPRLKLEAADREKYLAIGESDRMTLLFVKPE